MVFSILADQKPFVLSRRAMYLALAARVPATDDSLASDRNPLATTFVPNRFTRWSQIDSHLPDIPIRILAPPAQSIEWWSINDIVMRDGCRAVKPVAAIERIAPPLYGSLCYNRRTDGVIVYARGQDYADNPIVQPVQPNDVAIGPLQMLERSKLSQALPVEGVLPSPGTIISGKYPLSRVVSLYVKPEKYSIVPGLQQYVIEMTSPSAVGPDGYLTHLGLIPLPELELREIGVAARYSTP